MRAGILIPPRQMLASDCRHDPESAIKSALAMGDRETAAGLLMATTRALLLQGAAPGATAQAAWDLITAEELLRAGAVADARRKFRGAFAGLRSAAVLPPAPARKEVVG